LFSKLCEAKNLPNKFFNYYTITMHTQLVYTIFIAIVALALLIDFGLLNKKNTIISIKNASIQTIFWVLLAMAFFGFLWIEEGHKTAIEYLSAYLMEWSLSIDNIFVFILIFTSYKIKENYYGRVLLIGILMAIVFRLIFISIGLSLVATFSWILYVFGLFLIYTGYKMFIAKDDNDFNPQESKVYTWLQKYIPLVAHDGKGKFTVVENGKKYFTTLFLVVVMLAITDLVFAFDSIPAVMGVSRNTLVIYTSNIFAVLGLRSLFFLLRGAINKFEYLPKGIAIVLVFIGIKMLAEHFLEKYINKSHLIFISLAVIVLCLTGSIAISAIKNNIQRNS
jgi:tellurite resistance protein TerC